MKVELTIDRTKELPKGAVPALEKELLKRLQNQFDEYSLVTSITRLRMLRPRRSSFQTTSVSPALRARMSFFSAGLFATVPLIFSSKICSHPARSRACRCRSVFWSFVDTLT